MLKTLGGISMIEDKGKYLLLERAISLIRWILMMVILFSFPVSIYNETRSFNRIFILLIVYGLWNGCVHFLINRFNDTERKRYWVGIMQWGVDILVVSRLTILLETPFIGYSLYILLIMCSFLRYLNRPITMILNAITLVNMILSHTIIYGWQDNIYNEQVGIGVVSNIGAIIILYIFVKQYENMKLLVDVQHTDVAGLENNIRKMLDLTEITTQMQHSNTKDAIIRNAVFTISNSITDSQSILVLYSNKNCAKNSKIYHFNTVKESVMKGDENIPFQTLDITEDLSILRQIREYKNCIRSYEPLAFDAVYSLGTLGGLLEHSKEKNYIYLFPVMQHNEESGIIICNTLYRLEEYVCHYIAAIVEQIGTAFTRTEMLSEERKKAMYDSLTNVKSRLGLAETIPHLVTTSKRCDYTIGCIFVDIDYFKRFNDEYGHSIGDEALKIVAKIIKDNIRGQDVVGRYGGEEFVVFLQDVTEEETYQKAEMLRSKIEAFDLKEALGIEKLLTASFGVAIYPKDAYEFDEVVKRADMAMYAAKKFRNKVCIYNKEFKTID